MAKRIPYTQKTLKGLRDLGYEPGIVERFIKQAGPFGKRFDLYGIIDVVGIKPGEIIGIQSTSVGAFSRHIKLIMGEGVTMLNKWLEAGGKFELWAWGKYGEAGKMKRWKRRTFRFFDVAGAGIAWEEQRV